MPFPDVTLCLNHSTSQKHFLSNQTLGEGGQYILWCSPCLPRPQQQQPGCYCRRRKGICWNVWGQGFISLDLLRLVIYDQNLSKNTNKKKLKTFLVHQQLQVSSLNVSHQTQEWATLGQPRLNPGDWRWDLQDDRLMPMMSDLDPVPKYLLKVIRCCFKQDFSTCRCSCKKHGLICTQACKERRGTCCLDSYLVKIQQI